MQQKTAKNGGGAGDIGGASADHLDGMANDDLD